jgi:oxygen-independent coproporphyrinogen-3 oxidase
MEVNPDDATFEYLSALKSIGITRLSMGIQSFQDEHLKWMNRRHDSKQALTAFENARRAGFDNISLDLIFGFEKLTNELWADNLKIITKLRPEHISAYQLSIEPDSVLGKMYDKGDYSLPDDDFCQRQYQFMQTHLADEGYNQYEVSNFSLKGRESMHNSSYWTHEPYLGLGPAAHSFDGRERSWNVSDIQLYIDGIVKVDKTGKKTNVVLGRGNKDSSVHMLRHSVASYLKHTLKMDNASISKWLGHEDIRTTMIYLHYTEQEIIDMAKSFKKIGN